MNKGSVPIPWGKIIWGFCLAAPALWIAILVCEYGVDIPYWDQWDGICPLFEKSEAGTLRLADFFALHSEHRIFFPRLVMYGLARITHWNIRGEMLVIWLLAVACACNYWQLTRVTGWTDSRLGRWLLVGLCLFLFTPLQYETWLMGIQVVFLLPLVCLSACFWLSQDSRPAIGFISTALLSTVATFCVASGQLCWLLTFPLLLFRGGEIAWRRQKGWWIGWLSIYAGNLLLYFTNYKKPSYHPNTLEFAIRPFDAVQYALAYLGSDFGFGTVFSTTAIAALAGALLLLLFAVCASYLIWQRHDRELISRALPWLMPPCFSLANAALTTLGRLGFGVGQALSSRYITFAVLLPMGLCFLVPLIYLHSRDHAGTPQGKIIVGMALTSIVTFLAMLHTFGSIISVEGWKELERTRLIGKTLVLFINIVDERAALGSYVHAIVDPLKERANLLDRLGYLRPPLVRSNRVREIADASSPGSAEFGEIEQKGTAENGQWGMSGWAILPESGRSADGILITYDDPKGDPVIFELGDMGVPRKDLAAARNQPAYALCGWVKYFDDKKLPDGATVLKVWAFDAEKCRAYRIKGQASLQR